MGRLIRTAINPRALSTAIPHTSGYLGLPGAPRNLNGELTMEKLKEIRIGGNDLDREKLTRTHR